MIKYNNGIITIYYDTHIVLSQVATIGIDCEPSMFSGGEYQLRINGVAVYSSDVRKEVEEVSSFILEKLRQLSLSGV